MISSMFKIFNNIDPNTKILLAGCGGGHDCFTALPLYFSLKQYYPNIFIANLSFTNVRYLNKFPKIADSCYDIYYDVGDDICYNVCDQNPYDNNKTDSFYFPEYELSREISEHIYVFVDKGIKSYENAYTELVKKLGITCIILCDGGCDSIMTGKEEHLGTIVEDIMSMLTVNKLLDMKKISSAYLLLLGATVDTFGEIHREDFLKNIEALDKSGAQIEKILLTTNISDSNAPYVIKYKHIVEACQPYNSIVNSSICARLDGLYGNVLPPLLIKDGKPRCDKKYFDLDDYLVTYYLIKLSDVIDRIIFKDMIKTCNDSDEIDEVVMKFNADHWLNRY